MRHNQDSLADVYAMSFLVSSGVFLVVGFVGGPAALLAVLVLSALEITFSFDNAVVNAKVLQKMPELWQRMFMTVGILVAVFGMRLVLPILMVSLTAGLSMGNVVRLALERPGQYVQYLDRAHPIIASFGGIFLLMIFFEFMLDYGRTIHWFRAVERPLTKIGRPRQISLLFGLVVLAVAAQFLGGPDKLEVLIAGVVGIILYLGIRSIAEIFELKQEKDLRHNVINHHTVMRAGLVNFLYLELLDTSFSFDSVIGAFAITNMVLLIAAGLGVGAVWVRAMTLHIVRSNTLVKYRYLDHGVHYAIGTLAIILLLGIRYEIPEAVTGSAGIVIIGFALFSSWRYNMAHKPEPVKVYRR